MSGFHPFLPVAPLRSPRSIADIYQPAHASKTRQGMSTMQLTFLLSAIAAVTLGSCATVQRMNSPAGDDMSLRVANADYDRALIAADAVALNGIYTENFSFVGDKAELRNKGEQISYMTNGSVQLLSAASDEIAVTRLGPNHALLTGRFTGRFRAGAYEADFVERYTSIWIRQNSRWRLRHEHSSLLPSKG